MLARIHSRLQAADLIADLKDQITALEGRLAQSAAQAEPDDSGELLVRRVRESTILIELGEKQAELDKLLRHALRESTSSTSKTHALSKEPDTGTKTASHPVLEDHPASNPPKPPSKVALAIATHDLAISARGLEGQAWVKARRQSRRVGRVTPRYRRPLAYAAGTCALALSAFALLWAAGLPDRGTRGVAASSAARIDAGLPLIQHVVEESSASAVVVNGAVRGAFHQVASLDDREVADVLSNVGSHDDEGASAVAEEDLFSDPDSLESPAESTHAPEIVIASRTVFAPGFRGVNLRLDPSARSRSLLVVPIGTRVEILEGKQRAAGETWMQVRTLDGVEGWMLARTLAG